MISLLKLGNRVVYVPVAQWIERRPPKLEIEVRFLMGTSIESFFTIDLLINYFRHEISGFRARRRKNYEAYTVYMLNNVSEVGAEIWESQ